MTRVRWAMATTGVLGCVVVTSPANDVADGATSSSGESTSAGAPESSSDSSASSSGALPDTTGGALPPSPFPVYWAVTPSTLAIPDGADDVEIVRDTYVIQLSLGQTPAAVADPEAKYDELATTIEMQVPDDAREDAIGVLVNLAWEVPWCTVSDEDRETFAASPLGTGLDGDALADAWEQAGAALHVGLVERAREVRPQLRWGFGGLPRAEYFPNISDDPQVVRDERECSVVDTSMLPVWGAVDVVVPIVRMWYTALDAQVLERNQSYVRRFVEGARLAGKPTIPLIEGRYVQSSPTDTNPYEGLPILADDVAMLVEQIRLAGAAGFVYALEADGCWNFEDGCAAMNPDDYAVLFDAYWTDVVLPPLREL